MKALDLIYATRKYLDYIENHILNVEKAWKEITEKCKDMRFVYDDFYWGSIDHQIKNHDVSKLSEQEFVQYRKAFYPTNEEPKYDCKEAWQHHYENNSHHWENWTKKEYNNPWEEEMDIVHMIVDWTAMGYNFGDTAQEYFEKNKDKIKIPEIHERFMYEIFNRLKA